APGHSAGAFVHGCARQQDKEPHMVVVMAPHAEEQLNAVVAKVEGVGGEAFVSKGVERAIIGLIGDVESFSDLNLVGMPGVATVRRISEPYKLVSRATTRSARLCGWAPRTPGADWARLLHLHRWPPVETADRTLESAELARAAGRHAASWRRLPGRARRRAPSKGWASRG
ncbi:MAG: hypothetical protein V9E81_06910, partial [Marmoricola sp.]